PTASPERAIGVRIVTGRERPGAERAAAHLVAALRRLSAENGETYWGYRLERLFDAFVRIVQGEGGDLVDLYALLTDERRRDAARLATRDPESARFLDELAVLLRRTPDLLWPAASRLAKVAATGPLRALLAPDGGAVELDDELAAGRSILVRAPIGELGPEGSSFAATLLVGRLYLALTARAGSTVPERPTLIVLDEAHAVAARLLVEILAEGRKFGVDALLATQYAERLAPELRAAAVGSAGRHVVFRTPRGGAIPAGAWLGLGAETSTVLLPQLPFGEAVVARPDDPLGLRVARLVGPPVEGPGPWTEMVKATALEFGAGQPSAGAAPFREARVETLLLALLGARERGPGAVTLRAVIDRVAREEAEPVDPAAWLLSARLAGQRGWIAGDDEDVVLTASGARFLGVGGATGATSETGEHRALLIEVFRLFARHGERLEIVRQGRFDRRLPDGRCCVLAEGGRALPPSQLARYLDLRRRSWLWRCFGGRDVHVEAEVSGALRADRIRRGVEKARDAAAFALFVAADPRLARRIRSVLHGERLVPGKAQVWTLRGARAARPIRTEGASDES
ncbi:MAG: type IV secretory system conjugative DNA transfer family protein, partial [Thermoplasmata archaeon]|nr:type IV secretory system conjugative DNA transfer family protein [Thermoplasmata archaeon]